MFSKSLRVFAILASLVTVAVRWGTLLDFDAPSRKVDGLLLVRGVKIDALFSAVTSLAWMTLSLRKHHTIDLLIMLLFSSLCGTSLGTWLVLLLPKTSGIDTFEDDANWESGDPAENLFARP